MSIKLEQITKPQPKKLPEIFYIEDNPPTHPNHYYRAYRKQQGLEANGFLISQYRKGLSGQIVWICLDLCNGDIRNYNAKFYIWCFSTYAQANNKYKTHKEKHKTDGLVKLTNPVKCVVIDAATY
jgi:hypothetical protein